ncbi:MAG: phosphatidylserine/phosphatidylglycerophosphate/cardiolipin synthase family protein [Candidatus Riflebacteria bacterium]|nr:phosphatidylserine/phosphatidylglycerophosphate/cardiolipin synthase family protein [Candidatus Riflebacteria bacterium]
MTRRLGIFAFLIAFLSVSLGAFADPQAPAAKTATRAAKINPSDLGPNSGVNEAFDKIACTLSDPQALVRYIPDNYTSWYARWNILDSAKKSIDITYFIVEDDIFGMSVLGLLYKKAQAGVQLRIMMDARGTKGLTRTFMGQDVLQELKKFPNVDIRVYNPVHVNLLSMFEDIRNITASNHDKIVLVDDEWLITGGRNISKSYFVNSEDLPGVYRDTDILIKSKVVAQEAKTAFEEEFKANGNFQVTADLLGDWAQRSTELDLACQAMRQYLMGKGLLQADKNNLSAAAVKTIEKYNAELSQYKHMNGYPSFHPFNGEHVAPTRILDKDSLKGPRNDITCNLVALMDACKYEIIIQNPYVVLTDTANAALQRANDRGVKIVIQTNSPMSSDSLLTQAMFVGDWKGILQRMPNVEIYAYKLSSKLHSKTFVFDRKVAVIGTYNMDTVSEKINGEIVAAVKSSSFATRVALRIGEDMRNSFRYQISIGADGKANTVFGPESHSDPKVLERLNWLLKLHWLRPLI